MKVLQQIIIEDQTLVFLENPQESIKKIIDRYENEERDEYMGYETPSLTSFNFLGKEYPCISFWHDNEVPEKIDLSQAI